MKYDFETLKDRKNAGSEKWNAMMRARPDLPDDIVPFSVADMEFLNAPEISEGLADFIKMSVLGYSQPVPSYYDAVTGWMKRRHGWEVRPEWIIPYPGIVPALFHLTKCLINPGEGIIIMPPVYYPFRLSVKASGGTIVENPLIYRDGRYMIDFDDLEIKASQPENKLMILCSPHNPVGRVWTYDELKRVGEICIANGVTVICDEIHHDLIMKGYRHTCFAGISDDFARNSIICTAPSKTFNIAGLQISNLIIADSDLRAKVTAYKMNQGLTQCGIVSYKACELAYNCSEAWLEELLLVLDTNRQLVKKYIEENIPAIKVVALEGTYLQWLDCRGLGMDKRELEHFMKQEALLFFNEGSIFGAEGEGFERMNLACPSAILEAALDRLNQALAQNMKFF